MKNFFSIIFYGCVFFIIINCGNFQNSRYIIISKAEYEDKVYASWIGQIIGNIYGLPHECQYIDSHRPDSLRNFKYSEYHLKLMSEIDGAFSDDDTDIEYMYLLQMEEKGVEPSYIDLSKAWVNHVRDRVWLANRAAVAAMKNGLQPPLSGSKKFNPHWFQIDPQLVNEIWAVTSPGMIRYASEKSKWAAKITNEDWGVEPTIFYGAMYSAAFFESDINNLISIGLESVPKNGVFYNTVIDVKNIYKKYPDFNDWKEAREELYQKYYVNEPIETKTMWNANLNGACGILALLYGNGDFLKTLDIAAGLGFDADNQTATMSGLLAIANGFESLPKNLMYPFKENKWKKPFNNFYKNITRYDLPDIEISEIINKTIKQAEKIIVLNGGEIYEKSNDIYYKINTEADFSPKLEIAIEPFIYFEIGKELNYSISATYPNNLIKWTVDLSALPDGITFENGTFSGVPTIPGVYKVIIQSKFNDQENLNFITFNILNKNIARDYDTKIISSSKYTDTLVMDKMWITVAKNIFSKDVSVINDGKIYGNNSVFYSINSKKNIQKNFYGYTWNDTKTISKIIFSTGTMEENGGWFQNLNIEYLNEKGRWRRILKPVEITPKFDKSNNFVNKAHYMNYLIQFDEIKTKGIRINGDAGGGDHWHEDSKDYFFTSIAELAIY